MCWTSERNKTPKRPNQCNFIANKEKKNSKRNVTRNTGCSVSKKRRITIERKSLAAQMLKMDPTQAPGHDNAAAAPSSAAEGMKSSSCYNEGRRSVRAANYSSSRIAECWHRFPPRSPCSRLDWGTVPS